MDKRPTKEMKKDKNADPISGKAGAHPVGTGTGAAAGALAGAGIGAAVGGPVGLAAGGAAGAIAGGLAGKGVAEKLNPTVEDKYWRDNFAGRPYAKSETKYATLEPAYRYGWESRTRLEGKDWDQIEKELGAGWHGARGSSTLAWTEARPATRDAWNRLNRDV